MHMASWVPWGFGVGSETADVRILGHPRSESPLVPGHGRRRLLHICEGGGTYPDLGGGRGTYLDPPSLRSTNRWKERSPVPAPGAREMGQAIGTEGVGHAESHRGSGSPLQGAEPPTGPKAQPGAESRGRGERDKKAAAPRSFCENSGCRLFSAVAGIGLALSYVSSRTLGNVSSHNY